MKAVEAAVAAVVAVAVVAIGVKLFNVGEATDANTRPHFGCRAPTQEGEFAIITVTVRSGELVAECSYAGTRPSIPKKKGA